MSAAEELGSIKAYLTMYFEEKITLDELQDKVNIPFEEILKPEEVLPWK